jgi:hypothetical protein
MPVFRHPVPPQSIESNNWIRDSEVACLLNSLSILVEGAHFDIFSAFCFSSDITLCIVVFLAQTPLLHCRVSMDACNTIWFTIFIWWCFLLYIWLSGPALQWDCQCSSQWSCLPWGFVMRTTIGWWSLCLTSFVPYLMMARQVDQHTG